MFDPDQHARKVRDLRNRAEASVAKAAEIRTRAASMSPENADQMNVLAERFERMAQLTLRLLEQHEQTMTDWSGGLPSEAGSPE